MQARMVGLAVLFILPFETACDLAAYLDSQRYHEDFQYSRDLKSGGSLSVQNFNGSIEILGWEKNSVQITGTKYAGAESDLKEMRIDTTGDDSAIHIRTIRPESRRGNMGARYFIRVPRNVELEQVVSSNGAIRVEDIQGSALLTTSNGGVRMRNIDGRLSVKTSNGAIEGEDLDAEANLRTSNGAIRVGRMSGSLEAMTTNGGIHVRMIKAASGRLLRLQTSNGGIDLDLEALPGGGVSASTSNSSITLRLPSTAAGRINARTSHGTIQSDFDIRPQGPQEKNRLLGELGAGGPNLELTTSNGAIRILQR